MMMAAHGPTPQLQPELTALLALADRQWRCGQWTEAVETYRKILAIRPDLAQVHYDLGNLLGGQGKAAEAIAELEQALALRPDFAEAHGSLGLVLRNSGRFDEAAARFEEAIALRPDYALAISNPGVLRAMQGRFDEAAARFEQAIAVAPRFAEAYNNLGSILAAQDRFDEAALRLEQAIALVPNYVEARDNLGRVRWKQGELEKAAAHFREVIALQPGHAAARSKLGSLLRITNRIDEAISQFEQVRVLAPDDAEAQMVLATCYLLKGDFQRGWPAFEARQRAPGAKPLPDLPRWQGQALAGRRLLLVAEQGLGDTLQMLRYARLLKAQGAKLVLAVQPPLGRLLAGHPDLEEVLILGSAWPAADFYLPLLSAPGAFQTAVSTIPGDVPYIQADPELLARWRHELSQITGLKIGIAWQGSREYGGDRWRSIPLQHFAPLARLPGVQLVSLQKGLGTEQIAGVDFPLLDLADRLDQSAGPFMDTAAVIGNLDLVVSADTAIAHLAGAMAAPVFLALPLAGDWRWLEGRDDSPWYPTVRLFRQTKFDDWTDVFQRVADALRALRPRLPGGEDQAR